MSNLNSVELKTLVPAKDFARSRDFYQAPGFSMPWSDDNLAYLRHIGTRDFRGGRYCDLPRQAETDPVGLRRSCLRRPFRPRYRASGRSAALRIFDQQGRARRGLKTKIGGNAPDFTKTRRFTRSRPHQWSVPSR